MGIKSFVVDKFVNRFKEPSSWTALGGAASMIGVTIPPGILQGVSFIGAGIAFLLGFFLQEKPKEQLPWLDEKK